MSVSVELNAQLITYAHLRDARILAKLLAAFESDPSFAPTHWAPATGLRDPYDRAAILAAVQNAGEDGIVPTVMRTRAPSRYTAHWHGDGDGDLLFALYIETRGAFDAEIAPAFVEFVGHVATVLPIEWGHIDARFADQDPTTYMKSSGSYDHLGYYFRVGPTALFARTFFGARLLELAPQVVPIIATMGLPTERIANGGLRLDLAPKPWNCEPSVLKRAQEAVHTVLAPTSLLARPDGQGKYFAGLAWLPPTREDAQKYAG